jgi:hypothetical protein
MVIIQPPASHSDRQTAMPQGVSSYCISKAPAVNHLQPLSEGDPETGTPQQGRVDLTFFSSRTAWLLR